MLLLYNETLDVVDDSIHTKNVNKKKTKIYIKSLFDVGRLYINRTLLQFGHMTYLII
jgi:hypothetical protein